MVTIYLFATDIICLIVECIYWWLNPPHPLLQCLSTLHFLRRINSVLSPFNGKGLNAALRLISSPLMSRYADLCHAGLCYGLQGGSLQPSQGPHTVPLCSTAAWHTNCTWAHGGHWLFWGEASVGPSIFSPKELNTLNPELIWASTTPGEESLPCHAKHKTGFCSGLQQGWDSAGLCRLSVPVGWEGWECLASVPPPQLLVAPGSDTLASVPHTLALPWAGFLWKAALGCLQPSGLPSEIRHFSSISTDLGLIWVASVYRLYPLLNNASVTAVLSSYHRGVNVFNQRALDTY